MADLAVIILTYNEERHIERAICAVRDIASEIFVIDSYSTDKTVDIATSNGAIVLQNAFVNHAKQFQWAIDTAPITTAWTMRLDADEIVDEDLSFEINRRLPGMGPDIGGINLKRKHIFMGRWIRHGGRYPLILLRIWRTGYGRMEDRWMDEHMTVHEGRTVTFEGGFSDVNLNDLTFFTSKHNDYATRQAIEIINQRSRLFARRHRVSSRSASWQAAFKRFANERFYNLLPFPISACLYFVWRYIFQLGFLDGLPGLIYHFLQAGWYRFLIGAKVAELEIATKHLSKKSEIVLELSRLTGLKLTEE